MRERFLLLVLRASALLVLMSEGPACESKHESPSDVDGSRARIEECKRFGFVFAERENCDGCAPSAPTCACMESIGWQRCGVAKCVVDFNCAEVCKTLPDGRSYLLGDYGDLEAFRTCAAESLTVRCTSDDQCRGGRCMQAANAGGGECTEAKDESPCIENDDCLSGVCVYYDSEGVRRCRSDTSPSCNTDAHCLQGRCIIQAGLSVNGEPYRTGACSDGEKGQWCNVAADCRTFACVYGMCTTGDGPCDDPGDCTSSLCINGSCSSGQLESPCSTGADCASGYCGPTSPQSGRCVSGDNGTRCFGDAACRSGICTSFTVGRQIGWCTAGAPGDPCAADEDCSSRKCVVAPPATAGACNGGVNVPCGDGGVCFYDQGCHYQRCE